MLLPAGRYQYVKINLWNDREIDMGQAMYMRDPKNWEVTTQGEISNFIGYALQSHRYSRWRYILWLITSKIEYSPIRYVFIQLIK
jgi:hypothetical protein